MMAALDEVPKDRIFRAFDVHLEEAHSADPGDEIRQPHRLHAREAGRVDIVLGGDQRRAVRPGEAAPFSVKVEIGFAIAIPDRLGDAGDVGQVPGGEAELGEGVGVGLERVHFGPAAGEFERINADIGAGVDDDVSGPDPPEVARELDLVEPMPAEAFSQRDFHGGGQGTRRGRGKTAAVGLASGALSNDMAAMYDFKIEAADKPALYRELNAAAESLTDGEPDGIANMANVAALLWESLPELNWAGFYCNG